jgi:hypothetical protein
LVTKNKLDKYFYTHEDYEGTLYIGYPIIGEGESIDALWISKKYSIIIFDLYEGNSADCIERDEIRDGLYNQINSTLMRTKELMRGRNPIYTISVITIALSVTNTYEDPFILNDFNQLNGVLEGIEEWESPEEYDSVLSAIQVATKIHTASKRIIKDESSKGAILREIENSLATLDIAQNKAVIETANGLQRIRGLAGSGKTIIIALKAAYLYSLNPEIQIAITFYTKALKPMLESFIRRFVWEYTRSEPDMARIKILNAWGGLKDTGLYSELCAKTGIEFINYKEVATRKDIMQDEFSFVCQNALSQLEQDNYDLYDVILIDEAQDLPASFFLLCKKILKKNGKMVIAYDEMQTLTTGSLLNIKEVFSPEEFANEPYKPKRDIILPVCYRNPKEVIVTAHALGFGIYREGGLVQFFNDPALWKEVGYELAEGKFQGETNIMLYRTEESSPAIFNRILHDPQDIVLDYKVGSPLDEAKFVADEIYKNIHQDDLQMRDILVISLANENLERYVGALRYVLYNEYQIPSHIAGVTTSRDSFFQDNSITISGILRAKGNEAAVVYIIGAQDCMQDYNIRHHRNELFTAITRSKMWVRIFGYGEGMDALHNELEAIRKHKFTLSFKYPTDKEIEELDKVYSDYNENAAENKEIDNLIQKLLNDSNLTTKEKELLMKQMKNKGL